MIWAVAGGGTGLFGLICGLLFWMVRGALRRSAADTAARIGGMETLLWDLIDRPAPLAPAALEDLSTALKDDLAIMFTYAGRLAAISHDESSRVIARIDALEGIGHPSLAADPAPDLDPMALEERATDDIAPDDSATDEDAFDVDNLGVPSWATDDVAEDDGPSEDAPAEEKAFDVDNLGVPDWAAEDTGETEDATETMAQDPEADDLDTDEALEDLRNDARVDGDVPDTAPQLADMTATILAGQQDAADRLEERLSSVAAGIVALSSSTATSERLDVIAASGDTRVALLSALSRDVGAGLASLTAGQTALRAAIEGNGGGSDIAPIAAALSALQARTEILSHAVDAAAGSVDEAAKAAATAVMSAMHERGADDEARLQALCDRIAGLSADPGGQSGDALDALSGRVEGLQTQLEALTTAHRDTLARIEDAVAPDRLRLALGGAAARLENVAAARRAASRIVDMPALNAPPAKATVGE
ncbi:MAG: hypothetical protein ACJAVR_001536 [Paracoccaceae bacterium]|jgi:hypothetical protein